MIGDILGYRGACYTVVEHRIDSKELFIRPYDGDEMDFETDLTDCISITEADQFKVINLLPSYRLEGSKAGSSVKKFSVDLRGLRSSQTV